MRTLAILGAGTAGTMLAHATREALGADWRIVVLDRDGDHHYQPGYLFVPFGWFAPERVVKPRRDFLPDGVDYRQVAVERLDADAQKLTLADGTELAYDWLVVATGTVPRPELTPGLTDERIWRRSAHDFYTLPGAVALRDALKEFTGGRLLVHIAEMPIKCPVAPLEFALLVEDHFRKRRMRHKVDITYVTPLDGAFTRPVAAQHFGELLDDRSIRLASDFAVDHVDPERQELLSYDGRALPFDLLVSIPVHTGSDVIRESTIGDDMGFVKVDKHTLRSTVHPRIFAIGDAADVPTSKAGAVAHFEVEHLAGNLLAAIDDKPMPHSFDGHANCFVEAGRGQAMLLDFNYDTEPLTGTYPLPVVGPMKLLGLSHLNHWGKLGFEQVYWHGLLRGRPVPVPTLMSMSGKHPADSTGSPGLKAGLRKLRRKK